MVGDVEWVDNHNIKFLIKVVLHYYNNQCNFNFGVTVHGTIRTFPGVTLSMGP